MLAKQYALKHLIDSKGNYDLSSQDIITQEELALEVMAHFLGCTITAPNGEYVLTNLELYYGGIGDMASDWYRTNYPEKYGKKAKNSKFTSEAQFAQGPKIYFNQKGTSRYKRFDITVGAHGVAVSFLVRNVADSSGKLVGKINGQPNVVLNAMGFTDDHYNQELVIKDTHDQYVNDKSEIIKKLRFASGKYNGFEYDCPFAKKLWNYSISHKFL